MILAILLMRMFARIDSRILAKFLTLVIIGDNREDADFCTGVHILPNKSMRALLERHLPVRSSSTNNCQLLEKSINDVIF